MRALITGITGQDGSYLAEFLLEKNYEAYGPVHGSSLDAGSARKVLGWKPEVDFHQLIKMMMVESDLALLRQSQRSRAAAAGN